MSDDDTRSPTPLTRHGPDVLAVVAIGGMVGASARHLVNEWLPTASGEFPWSTFAVNAAGSFLLGLLLVAVVERARPGRYLRPFLATGVLGAFTTMAAYQVEVTVLLKDGHLVRALLYGPGSLVVGLAVAYAGVRAGHRALPPPAELPR